jgi:hypothetical protein
MIILVADLATNVNASHVIMTDDMREINIEKREVEQLLWTSECESDIGIRG